ncbi:AAA family ATPase [Duganella sp. FT109W]|uniref:AAA family ATPase n=1 Tax=Duganella margarita TaxID=2692170 RepID=A0ABW9WR88_9BURK|nr:AAA family ATPase [Duganella margarita]MYN42769.1 AAA family ATPase [Duganella margarita]
MKIDNISIKNFRGITNIDVKDLGDTIIVAGQNGSGKSCIFDAIRLLKSVYGGYQQNEFQHFFGEFAIQLHGGSANLKGLFNDSSQPVVIECAFRIRDAERSYINQNGAELLETTLWQILLPEAYQYGGYRKALFSAQFRERQPEVTARVNAELPLLMAELALPQIVGRMVISPEGAVTIQSSHLLTVIFSNYRPRQIGVIDFHGAQRHYSRENVQGINLNLDQATQQQSQHAIYNYNNKYNNVKSEMAGSYIKELLAERSAPGRKQEGVSITNTLKELFESFFPDKKFLGPQPTAEGSLAFPVQTASGAVHDLDELSSGEKEILYGYLRIRSSAPRDSIILLDEPELHLNPRLIRGLPDFYRKHLGEALENQLWLVTHSDALIREAVGKPGFNVFHMLPCGTEPVGSSQLRPLVVTADLEMATADLVGDLATYRPGGKGLIFEGGGDSDFDKTFSYSLFQSELKGINLISGTNKIRVKLLHEILDRAYKKGDLPTKFYAITDSDSEESIQEAEGVNRFVWDVYHIENYLLEPAIIADVLNSLGLNAKYDENAVALKMSEAARKVVPTMLVNKMRSHANSAIVRSIKLGFDPSTLTIGAALHSAASKSSENIVKLITDGLSEEKLVAKELEFRSEFEQSFSDGSWKKKLPGREILKQFIDGESGIVGYEIFRNLIAARMAQTGHKPLGMKAVFDKIIAD